MRVNWLQTTIEGIFLSQRKEIHKRNNWPCFQLEIQKNLYIFPMKNWNETRNEILLGRNIMKQQKRKRTIENSAFEWEPILREVESFKSRNVNSLKQNTKEKERGFWTSLNFIFREKAIWLLKNRESSDHTSLVKKL